MSIRILIGDDHGVLRAGLRALLSAEPSFEVVGEAADGDEVLALANELTEDRPWLGEFYLVAIYDRALSQDEVSRNFNARPPLPPRIWLPLVLKHDYR